MPKGCRVMFDLSKPVSMDVIVGSIGLIVVLVGIGLAVVAYYKKKQDIK
jgi:uncharacterized membrane protein